MKIHSGNYRGWRIIFLCSAYDRAAIKFRGVEADINFNIEDYEDDLKQVSVGERKCDDL